ncbi:MAG: heme-binding protein [Pseudomonadota bacterium]
MQTAPALLTAAAIPLLAGCSVFGGKAAEEPPYDVERAVGDIEIRTYSPYAIATTVAKGSRDDALSEGFLRLFDYITGDNAVDAEIAMTAPVLAAPDGAPFESMEIAMTAPVLSEASEAGWAVSFVLPDGMTAADAPRPLDPAVTIEDRPPRRIATYRFAGFNTPTKAEKNRTRLAEWLDAEGLAHQGDWSVAGYHPPWTIPWLRRYEVWVTLN